MNKFEHLRLWRMVEGGVRSAFYHHPEYLTEAGVRAAVRSVTKRVVGNIAGHAKGLRKQASFGMRSPSHSYAEGVADLVPADGMATDATTSVAIGVGLLGPTPASTTGGKPMTKINTLIHENLQKRWFLHPLFHRMAVEAMIETVQRYEEKQGVARAFEIVANHIQNHMPDVNEIVDGIPVHEDVPLRHWLVQILDAIKESVKDKP